ncbi:pre-mod(mdg4)-AA [Musca autumnalis]|uniref:pre-mod(mdg4)-AA n=1 Tax=Musca autumnalis TaxID=221902 RepID=UPI003CE7895F
MRFLCRARVRTNPSGDRVSIIDEDHNHDILMERQSPIFSYNCRGHLIYKGYAYSCFRRTPTSCIVQWRCTQYHKHKCPARLATKNKNLLNHKGEHNHEATKLKTFVPQIYQ